jgi:carboxypeptidase C (cathepsin A)
MSNDLYFTGESYCGKYAPFVALELLKQNLNLKGIAIGNAMVDPINQVSAFSSVAYNFGFVSAAQKLEMEAAQIETQNLIRLGWMLEVWSHFNYFFIVIIIIFFCFFLSFLLVSAFVFSIRRATRTIT